MSNFLRKYSTEADFNDADIDCKDTVVSYITEVDSIEYAPEYINGASIKAKSIKLSSSSPIKIEDCKATDILWAMDDGSYIMTDSGTTTMEQGTAIGICVIPTSHDVYGDGTCAVMSLSGMSYSTPTVGVSGNTNMYWGYTNKDFSGCTELIDYTTAGPSIGSGSTLGNSIISSTGYYLPSDKFSAVQCPHDSDAKYYSTRNKL